MTARREHHADFASEFVDPRNIEIWLPPSYDAEPDRRYPVLYMHDGQALFEPGLTFSPDAWEVDTIIERMVVADEIREPIVVGIWNTDKRFREYQPAKPFAQLDPSEIPARERLDQMHDGGPLGDAYVRFIAEELKPWVDESYPTLPGREDTFMMGSSMGGMITVYALSLYPELFAAVAALSTHWPLALENNPVYLPVLIRYFEKHLPAPGRHRIYFDYGTETIDEWYEPYQLVIDEMMRKLGYTSGVDWVTLKFEGAGHSETAWRERLHEPLAFLLGPVG